jgi:hypothetical protein
VFSIFVPETKMKTSSIRQTPNLSDGIRINTDGSFDLAIRPAKDYER